MSDQIPFAHMCKGPNKERIEHHQEQIKFHEMMVIYYGLTKGQQQTFMIFCQSLLDDR